MPISPLSSCSATRRSTARVSASTAHTTRCRPVIAPSSTRRTTHGSSCSIPLVNERTDKMRTVYHADLSDALAGEDYWVHARGKRYPLVPHTPETLARLRTEAPDLSAVPNERLTHFTETPIELPDDCVVRVHIKHTLR